MQPRAEPGSRVHREAACVWHDIAGLISCRCDRNEAAACAVRQTAWFHGRSPRTNAHDSSL